MSVLPDRLIHPGRYRRWIVVLAICGAPFLPPHLAGQEPEDRWNVETEVGGSLFFGSRDQSQFMTRTEVERSVPQIESSLAVQFVYGVSTDRDGVTSVNRRSWVTTAGFDFWPEDLIRPFVSAQVESSFERRIAFRYDTGMGFKVDHRIDRNNRVEFSLSLLAERTYSRIDAGGRDDDSLLARWYSNLRVRRTLSGDRISLDFLNTYRPIVDDLGAFTFSSRNGLTVLMTQVVALRLSLRVDYDSGAVDRGADTNTDGQVQISVVARF